VETITLKINKRSSYGKAVLELIKVGINEKKGVEIVKEKSPYNPKFVERIRKSEKEIKQGKYKILDTKDIWGSLGL
jgi:hypothetical protein